MRAIPTAILASLLVMALGACGDEATADASGDATSQGGIPGPYPATVSGGVAYSYPLDDDGGTIKLGLYEYEGAAILVSAATYDAKGLDDEDDPEVTLVVTPVDKARCGGEEPQCFEGK